LSAETRIISVKTEKTEEEENKNGLRRKSAGLALALALALAFMTHQIIVQYKLSGVSQAFGANIRLG
jgi:hypothetical protein